MVMIQFATIQTLLRLTLAGPLDRVYSATFSGPLSVCRAFIDIEAIAWQKLPVYRASKSARPMPK
jgi:hypothetical protein